MEMRMDDFVHVLIEMTSEPDCRFIGSWLMKAAEAQTFWSQALLDPDFKNRVADLCAFCVPSLECAALDILCALKQRNHVLAADLYEIEAGVFSVEFGIIVELGFFAFTGRSYHMVVPETVAFENVKQAALNLISTAKDVGDGVEAVRPERLLHTLSQTEAETWRSRLIAMRRFSADPPRGRTVQ
jgi:hypothetical protein